MRGGQSDWLGFPFGKRYWFRRIQGREQDFRLAVGEHTGKQTIRRKENTRNLADTGKT